MQKWFHLRCCKGSVFSSQGFPTLNISKKIKLHFWYFYCLSTKIKSVTMLPLNIYKFFYLSAMVANILGYLRYTFSKRQISPWFLSSYDISEGLLIPLFFRVKLTKSIEQSAILKIVLPCAKKSRGKRKDLNITNRLD